MRPLKNLKYPRVSIYKTEDLGTTIYKARGFILEVISNIVWIQQRQWLWESTALVPPTEAASQRAQARGVVTAPVVPKQVEDELRPFRFGKATVKTSQSTPGCFVAASKRTFCNVFAASALVSFVCDLCWSSFAFFKTSLGVVGVAGVFVCVLGLDTSYSFIFVSCWLSNPCAGSATLGKSSKGKNWNGRNMSVEFSRIQTTYSQSLFLPRYELDFQAALKPKTSQDIPRLRFADQYLLDLPSPRFGKPSPQAPTTRSCFLRCGSTCGATATQSAWPCWSWSKPWRRRSCGVDR